MNSISKTNLPDEAKVAADVLFEEMVAIFEATDGMEMGTEERLRLCANAAILVLRHAGFDLVRN